MIETVDLTDADKRNGYVTPFDILDRAAACLRDWRDDPDHPDALEWAEADRQTASDYRSDKL